MYLIGVRLIDGSFEFSLGGSGSFASTVTLLSLQFAAGVPAADTQQYSPVQRDRRLHTAWPTARNQSCAQYREDRDLGVALTLPAGLNWPFKTTFNRQSTGGLSMIEIILTQEEKACSRSKSIGSRRHPKCESTDDRHRQHRTRASQRSCNRYTTQISITVNRFRT